MWRIKTGCASRLCEIILKKEGREERQDTSKRPMREQSIITRAMIPRTLVRWRLQVRGTNRSAVTDRWAIGT